MMKADEVVTPSPPFLPRKEKAAAGGVKPCSVCNQSKPSHGFSNKQWSAKAHSRKCLDCVAHPQAGSAGGQAGAAEGRSSMYDCLFTRMLAPRGRLQSRFLYEKTLRGQINFQNYI